MGSVRSCSAHLSDVMMGRMSSPGDHIAMRPAVNPVVDELRRGLNKYRAKYQARNGRRLEGNRYEGVVSYPLKGAFDRSAVIVGD